MNRLSHTAIDSKTVFLLLAVAAITLAGGLFIVKASAGFAFVLIAVVVIGIVSFLSMEIALYLLIISMLLGEFIDAAAIIAINASFFMPCFLAIKVFESCSSANRPMPVFPPNGKKTSPPVRVSG